MFIIDQYPLAVAFCFVAMLSWGSWANTQKLATQAVPTTIFYQDYVRGILLFTLVIGFTLGSYGTGGRSLMADFQQSLAENLLYALAGGVIFNIANILVVVGIQLAGMAIAFPVGVGIALILGVVINYIALPQGHAGYLFTGVLAIMLAIVFSALAYRANQQQTRQPNSQGIVIAAVGGVLMGFFFRFVAASMATDFVNPAPGLLTPYTALIMFAAGITVSTPIFLPILRRFTQKPGDEKINYYTVSGRNHLIGMLGGAVWCLGMASSLLASGAAGFAISYGLGQGATIIAVLWGIFIWREFRHAPPVANRWLLLMGLCYALGLVLIITAKL